MTQREEVAGRFALKSADSIKCKINTVGQFSDNVSSGVHQEAPLPSPPALGPLLLLFNFLMATWPVKPTLEDLLDLHKQPGFTNANKNNGGAHVNEPGDTFIQRERERPAENISRTLNLGESQSQSGSGSGAQASMRAEVQLLSNSNHLV